MKGPSTALAASTFLHRRTLNRSIGTKHAAITGLRFKYSVASKAFIEKHAGILGHGLFPRKAAIGAGNNRL